MHELQQPGTTSAPTPVSHGRPDSSTQSYIGAAILTVFVVALHVVNFSHANGLWRDEANSVVIATMPKLDQLWSALAYDSFPLLHFLAIRCWAFIAGSGDSSLRIFGLIIGLLIIAGCWLKSAKTGKKPPIALLLLLGLNPLMIRFLDGLRPNGLGVLTTLLAFTAVWLMLENPSPKRLMIASAALILCTQTLFQNALLVLAIGIAAIITGLLQHGLRRAALLTLPFILAALSLLPYIGKLHKASAWSPVAMTTQEQKFLLRGLMDLLSSPAPWSWLLWLVALLAAAGGIIAGLQRSAPTSHRQESSYFLTVYAGSTMVGTVVIFMLFLAYGVSISPKAWHYIPMAALFAIAADTLISNLARSYRVQIAIMAVAAVVTVASAYPAYYSVQQRSSSMDVVAAAIALEAQPDDIVILMPWFYAVSFNRYYHGKAPWISFPSLQDNSIHRFDLLKEKMQHPEGVSRDLDMIIDRLRKGGRVWLVGSAYTLEPGAHTTLLPPAPLPSSGWSSEPYKKAWADALMAALTAHAKNSQQLFIKSSDRMTPMEAPVIAIYQDYKD